MTFPVQFALCLGMLAYAGLAGFSFWTMIHIRDIQKQDQAPWVVKCLFWHGVGVSVALVLVVALAGALTVLRIAWRVIL